MSNDQTLFVVLVNVCYLLAWAECAYDRWRGRGDW